MKAEPNLPLPDDKSFGARLKWLMKTYGDTRLEFYNETGLSPTLVANWINHGYSPRLNHLICVAEYYGVSIEFLAGIIDEPNPRKITNQNTYGLEPVRRWMKADAVGGLSYWYCPACKAAYHLKEPKGKRYCYNCGTAIRVEAKE